MLAFHKHYIALPQCYCISNTVNDDPIYLERPPLDECGGVELMCQQCDPFPSDRIITRQDTTFEVVIGPSANPRGYTAITGAMTFQCIGS